MNMKLDTVRDAINLQGLCTELSSRLSDFAEVAHGTFPSRVDSLKKAAEVLDFISESIVPNLRIND